MMKYLMEGIETERLIFRRIETSDFSSWIDFFADPTSFEHWKSERQTPEIECGNWYKKQFSRYETNTGGMNALIEKKSGELIGHAGLLVQTVDNKKELEIAYSLLSAYRNKGFATEAAFQCKEYAFQNDFSTSLISIISLTNIQSANVALKNRMKVEKQTMYNENPVNIYRVTKIDYQKSK